MVKKAEEDMDEEEIKIRNDLKKIIKDFGGKGTKWDDVSGLREAKEILIRATVNPKKLEGVI